jgi:hypothetical protein
MRPYPLWIGAWQAGIVTTNFGEFFFFFLSTWVNKRLAGLSALSLLGY